MMIMIFSMELVNNKVIDHLLIYLVLNFHSHRPNGLRIIAVRILLSEMTCSIDRSERLNCLT